MAARAHEGELLVGGEVVIVADEAHGRVVRRADIQPRGYGRRLAALVDDEVAVVERVKPEALHGVGGHGAVVDGEHGARRGRVERAAGLRRVGGVEHERARTVVHQRAARAAVDQRAEPAPQRLARKRRARGRQQRLIRRAAHESARPSRSSASCSTLRGQAMFTRMCPSPLSTKSDAYSTHSPAASTRARRPASVSPANDASSHIR